jgi:hypothetical protein
LQLEAAKNILKLNCVSAEGANGDNASGLLRSSVRSLPTCQQRQKGVLYQYYLSIKKQALMAAIRLGVTTYVST